MCKKEINVGVIVQARMGSSRLSGKVLKEVCGKPLLWFLIQRLRKCKTITNIVLATSTNEKDDSIEKFCKEYDIDFFRGSEEDVLDRYYQCAKKYNFEHIVRITGDCPLVDPELVDEIVKIYEKDLNVDLLKTDPTYPEGFDTEIFSFKNLELSWNEAKLKSEREHVTAFLWKNDQRFQIKRLPFSQDYSFLRLTVDEGVDFEVVKEIIEELFPQKGAVFHFQDILTLYKNRPEIFEKNKDIIRNEGYSKSLKKDTSGDKF